MNSNKVRKMATVKQLMAKFQVNNKPASATPLTPVSFEEQKKMTRQKELEEIRLAREKAKLYNATLRAKTIQMAKEQSARTRALISPRTGSSRTFNFEGAANPGYIGSHGVVLASAGSFRESKLPSSGDDEEVYDGEEDELFVTAPQLERNEESFEGKSEEKKDVLTALPKPTEISPRANRLSGLSQTQVQPKDSALALPPARTSNLSAHTLKDAGAIPSTDEIPTTSRIRTSGNKSVMTSLTSAPSMQDVIIPPPVVARETPSPSVATHRKDSDMSQFSTMGVPEGGFDEIHDAVRFNRPSVSDLLLRPTYGERNYSVTSVGPMVETPEEEPCRLKPGVDIKTILHTFYSTYAPEKLDDLDIVLRHFKGRTEALLFTLECKYFVAISPDGLVTPFPPSEMPAEYERVEDERTAARRSTMLSTATDMTDFTTDSYKGYIPADMKDGGLPSTLANSWAVRPKHDSGGRRDGRKTALMLKKAGSDLL